MLREVGQPALPLGVHPDPGGRRSTARARGSAATPWWWRADTWIDAAANYDGQIRTGRFFDGDFTGTGLRLREFESAFRETGQPMDFVSRVDLLNPDGSVLRQQDIRVNHPAEVERHPHLPDQLRVGAPCRRSDDADGVAVRRRRGHGPRSRARGRVGVRDAVARRREAAGRRAHGGEAPDVAIELELWPDSRGARRPPATGGEPQAMLTASSTRSSASPCGEGGSPSLATNRLDTSFMRGDADAGIVGAGRTADLRSGASSPSATRARGRRWRSPSCASTRCSR